MREKAFTGLFLCLVAMGLVGCNWSKSDVEAEQTYVDSFEVPEVPALPTDTLTVADLEKSRKTMLDSVKHDPPVSDEPYEMPYEAPPTPPASAKPKTKMVYANDVAGYVNVRKEPTVKSEALGRLEKGGKGAKYIATEGEWYKVEYKGQTAYVKSVYATFESVPAKPKSESKPADKEKSIPADAATI